MNGECLHEYSDRKIAHGLGLKNMRNNMNQGSGSPQDWGKHKIQTGENIKSR